MAGIRLSGDYNTGFHIATGGNHNVYNNYQAGQSGPASNVLNSR